MARLTGLETDKYLFNRDLHTIFARFCTNLHIDGRMRKWRKSDAAPLITK